MTQFTLLRAGNPLADPLEQLCVLRAASTGFPSFDESLQRCSQFPLVAGGVEVLQVNVGKVCNQTCAHCHVDAGPDRRESMSQETAEACLAVLARTDIPTLDITGGAPEMNPQFRRLVEGARNLGRRAIDRCNLTILVAPGFEDLAAYLAEHEVEIVASLPCYLEENTDRQRGDGVFARSIEALRELNSLGYGRGNSKHILTLVYNPVGVSLPPDQDELEAAYREQLAARHGVAFDRLYTIANMPISRFLDDLLRSGKYEAYMQKLIDAFNPAAVEGLMCRTTLSVDWRGRLYDCDFNQMLDLPLAEDMPRTIFEFDAERLAGRRIATGPHCFGCTAGAGSSCQGAIAAGRRH
ncbi:MAG: radical SAM protein [Planctomycetota bacterium]|nr:MAG: radical SAM protein [Planctomycetota bacterium]